MRRRNGRGEEERGVKNRGREYGKEKGEGRERERGERRGGK